MGPIAAMAPAARTGMFRFAFLVALLLIGVGVPAQAASFDCGKAATPFEKAICADPDLSKADERLAKTYSTAIGGLSEAAIGALRADQRQWLDFARRACTEDAQPMSSGSYDEMGMRCLRGLFSTRSAQLETSRMIGGLRFYPRAAFATLPDPEAEPDSAWAVASHELSYVQLDADADIADKFNAFVEAEAVRLSDMYGEVKGTVAMDPDPGSDTSNSIAVQDVSGQTRITLDVGTYWYGHGAAHGNWTQTYLHYLPREGRALAARDIFGRKGWQKALLDLTVEALNSQHDPEMLMIEDTSYIADAVTDPSRWDLSDPYSLIVQFQPYEVAAYAYGAPTARVSWEALADYLAEGNESYR
ncbi:hypothetical protein DMC47_09820 [Nostoc sp. 3335mG]|nr:hypothetical protein DMC47_09820 [Nostoc sp. 3335mG]